LKIWRFYEDEITENKIKQSPVPLHQLEESGFIFSSRESYVVFLIYKSGTEHSSNLVNFPHSLWGVVQSASNLTPRGLASSLSNKEELS